MSSPSRLAARADAPSHGARRASGSSVPGARRPDRDRLPTAAVERWFASAARPLPWRTTPRDPWASLVSEVMAQQTQIARVLERYPRIMASFPTPLALAEADEQDVLALWQGMGYYRRARLLQSAARVIVQRHSGEVPRTPGALRELPGVGRYTAGAVASIAMGQPEPIVDGNIARVLLRVHGREGRPGDRLTDAWCWKQATDLVGRAANPAAFNEGLMELGAVVCTPRAPACERCPLAAACIARRDGLQPRIPAPRTRAETPLVFASVLLAIDPAGRILMEHRPTVAHPAEGCGNRSQTRRSGMMWAGLWQLPTLESSERPTTAALRAWAGGPVGRAVLGFEHQTSHRLFEFKVRVARCEAGRAAGLGATAGRRWMVPAAAADLPLSNPQRRILEALSPRP